MAHPKGEINSAVAKRVVYTALIGEYEELNEQPVAANSDVTFVCFTDNLELESNSWEFRRIEPRFPLDSIRSARFLKVHGPELLSEFAESLWIDNSVLLRGDPADLLDAWLTDTDIALPRHSYRTSVLGEFDTVATQGYDDPARVYEQLIHYSTIRPAVLNERPFWTAILARRHTPVVAETMQVWLEHILRYSRRDQLSVNFALSQTGIGVTAIEIDNWSSEWHQWPQLSKRKWNVTQDRLAAALRIPSADIGRLENVVLQLADQIEALKRDAEEERKRADAYRTSTSWAVTRPLRAIREALRR